jgi:hypothetical protein
MPDVETVPAPTLPDTDRELDEGGDHDRFAHYVRKDRIVPSAVEGSAVVALCGKKWVPTRDPERYPVCPTCKEIFEQLKGS